MKKRTVQRLKNLERLRELHGNHPSNQPQVTVEELQFYHFRLSCGGRMYDYWPSTGKVWEVNSSKRATVMPVDDLWNLVVGSEQPALQFTSYGWSADREHEKRVREFLRRHH